VEAGVEVGRGRGRVGVEQVVEAFAALGCKSRGEAGVEVGRGRGRITRSISSRTTKRMASSNLSSAIAMGRRL